MLRAILVSSIVESYPQRRVRRQRSFGPSLSTCRCEAVTFFLLKLVSLRFAAVGWIFASEPRLCAITSIHSESATHRKIVVELSIALDSWASRIEQTTHKRHSHVFLWLARHRSHYVLSYVRFSSPFFFSSQDQSYIFASQVNISYTQVSWEAFWISMFSWFMRVSLHWKRKK